MLNKIYLDYQMGEHLTFLGLKEKWIDKDYYGNPIDDRDPYYINRKNESKLLLILTLFEKVDSYFMDFDYSKLISEGLIKEDSKITNPSITMDLEDYESNLSEKDKTIFDGALLNSSKILELSKLNTLKSLLDKYKATKRYWRNDFIPNQHELHENFSDLLNWNNLTDRKNYFEYLWCELNIFKQDLAQNMYLSAKEKCTFNTMLKPNKKNRVDLKEGKIIDDLYYITKIKLEEEFLYFPQPKTLDDVFKIRERKEIVRFREVLSYWIKCLEGGEINLVTKMKKDIKLANKDLKRIEGWRMYKESPFNFWVNSIGGHIPILSNVLTVIAMVGGLYEQWGEDKHNWVMMMNQ